MSAFRIFKAWCLYVAIFTIIASSADAVEFAGGTGLPNDPYQIATAQQLVSIGSDPNLLNKHFVLVNDIDLDPNLPGRKVFDKAVIAPAAYSWERYGPSGIPFTGVFDGNGHTISHLMVAGEEYLGLFGRLESGGGVRNLGLVDVNITGSDDCIGGLVGLDEDPRKDTLSSTVSGILKSAGCLKVTVVLAWQPHRCKQIRSFVIQAEQVIALEIV